jgi:hypothetical protein
MKVLEHLIVGAHVFVLLVVALLLADYPVCHVVSTIYRVMHEASVPAELLYVLTNLRLRTAFVHELEMHV